MAPSTRSKNKKRNRVKTPNTKNKDNTKQKKPDKQETKCRLLELPPELRNRIYYFSKEYVLDPTEPPLLSKSTLKRPLPSYSCRKFLSLTQTCKQIREEFRPLWLRDSSVRIKMGDISGFLDTFYPKPAGHKIARHKIAGYENAPKLLVISWNHDTFSDVLLDLKPLLQLRAHCPTFVAEFGCHRLIEHDLPNRECGECGHTILCNCEVNCGHEDAMDEVFFELSIEYRYTEMLDSLLANGNEAWLKAIRNDVYDEIKVEFAVDVNDDEPELTKPTVFIRFMSDIAPPVIKKKDPYNSAVRYLKKMGMFDLGSDHLPDFVVGEFLGKITRSLEGCQHATPLYSQVHICGHDGEDIRSTSQRT